MPRFALLLPALALLALGAYGLYDADKESQTDFIIAGVELAAGITLIGIAFMVGRRVPEPMASETDSADRAEVIERLQRHTEALRRAEARERTTVPDSEQLQVDEVPGAQTEPDRSGRRHGRDPHWVEFVPPPEKIVHETTATEMPSATYTSAAPGDTEAVRLPQILLLKLSGAATIADIESAPPLGSRDEVLARLREIVPDLEIDAKGRSEHAGPDHSVRLDLGEGDVVHTIVIEAAGGTGISMIRRVLENTGWRAFVPKSGRFIEPDALESVAIPNQD